jgi:hypothetical protein
MGMPVLTEHAFVAAQKGTREGAELLAEATGDAALILIAAPPDGRHPARPARNALIENGLPDHARKA